MDLNVKSMTETNELGVMYGEEIPACLRDKPSSVVLYVLNQIKSTQSHVFQVKLYTNSIFIQQGTIVINRGPRNRKTAQAVVFLQWISSNLYFVLWQKMTLPSPCTLPLQRAFMLEIKNNKSQPKTPALLVWLGMASYIEPNPQYSLHWNNIYFAR